MRTLNELMQKQKEQDEALNNKNMKKSEKEKAKLREEARLEIEKQQAAVDAARKAHQAAIEEQEALKQEIEREKEAKARAEVLNAELNTVCSNLKHKALAFVMQ